MSNKSKKVLLRCLVVAGALMIAERVVRPAVVGWLSPVHGAQWIWAPGLERHTTAQAFYAVRDFDLTAAPTKAEISIQADAEYILLVNGQRVGSNRYVAGAPLDRYEVSNYLRIGRNRLAVELRTPRGIGGLLCNLEIDADRAKRIVSDDRWMIQRRYQPRLRRGEPLLPTAQRAKAWARPPTGRWGWPKIDALRPDLKTITLGKRPLPARRASSREESAEWTRRRRPKRKSSAIGAWVTFDWNRPIQGFIKLSLAEREFAGALLFVGLEPPDPFSDEPANFVISVPGRGTWTDTEPRRFRYVTVVGISDLTGAEVLKIDADQLLDFQARKDSIEGVYGLRDPQLRTPMENEIWRQVHRLASERMREEV